MINEKNGKRNSLSMNTLKYVKLSVLVTEEQNDNLLGRDWRGDKEIKLVTIK